MFCKQRGGTEGSWHRDRGIAELWQATGAAFPQLMHKDKEGPKGKAGSVISTHTHTHFLSYPAPPPAAHQQSKTQHKELMDRTHCKGKVQSFCSSDRDIPLQSPSHPPKGQSCFTHLIFGRTGSAVTFPIL